MNAIETRPSIIGVTSTDFPVRIPPGRTLHLYPLVSDAQVRHIAGTTEYIPVPAGSELAIGPSPGQTVYVRGANTATVLVAMS